MPSKVELLIIGPIASMHWAHDGRKPTKAGLMPNAPSGLRQGICRKVECYLETASNDRVSMNEPCGEVKRMLQGQERLGSPKTANSPRLLFVSVTFLKVDKNFLRSTLVETGI